MKGLFIGFFVLTISVSFFSAPLINAQETENAPSLYDVEIDLLDVGDIDYTDGKYSLSFWITISFDDLDVTTPPEIDFVNGRVDEIEHEYFSDDNSYSAKVHGTFFTDIDLRNYPIMKLSLPIIMEPIQFETHQIKFIDKKSSTTDDKILLNGLIYQNTETKVLEHTYSDGDIFSRYIVTYNFETPFFSSFMVGIFPILIIGAVVFLSFLINPFQDIRPEMAAFPLIAAVFFHVIDIGQDLPPLEYLTLEDKLMTVLYAFIIFGMVEVATQRKFNENNKEKAEVINKKFRLAIPIVLIGTFALVWWF